MEQFPSDISIGEAVNRSFVIEKYDTRSLR